jgi:hypothetical protein
MVRTVFSEARAFLSDRFARIDNIHVLEAALPSIDRHKWRVEQCSLTPTRMYCKVTMPNLEAEVKVGELVRWGLIFSNSEVGSGAVNVNPFVLTLACTNGMVIPDNAIHRAHLGQLQNVGLLSSETIRADDNVFLMKVRDTIEAMADRDRFLKVVENLRGTTRTAVEDPVKATELLSKRVGLGDGGHEALLNRFATGGDSSLWGLVSALTREAQEQPDYNRRIDLETTAGELCEKPTAWRALLAA